MTSRDDYYWLVSSEGRKWIELAAGMSSLSLVVQTERLRRDLTAGRAHLVLEQLELRERAREKFTRADHMFFTRRLLEQATDEWIAQYKACRFPAGALVADLCCGLGGDLLGLALRGPVIAVDRDPVAVLLAKANLATANSALLVADVEHFRSTGIQAWHIDPDRRPAGRRTTRVELHEPGPDVVHDLLTACPHAAIKLAPAATLAEPWWQDAELEWISRDRQCRQLVAWFGDLAQYPPHRRATVIRADGQQACVVASFVGAADVESSIAPRIGRFVLEPDAAVLAAKLEGAMAASHGLAAVAGGVAYFTGDEPIDDPALACFEVLEVMPYRSRTVRAWLSERQVGRVEVKKRGVRLEPETVRRELKPEGDNAATILLAPINGQATAIIARRVR